MEFSEVYERFRDDIAVTAIGQFVSGLDYDDVVSEMTACLWKAWQSHDPAKGPLGTYWWSLWLNKRRDLGITANAKKRPPTTPYSPEYLPEGRYLLDLMPSPPEGTGPMGQMVWRLLSEGLKPVEVMNICGLSRRAYYTLIKGWRTEQVRNYLSSI